MASARLWLKLLVVVGLALACVPRAKANEAFHGWCELGNQSVVTSGISSTTKVQLSNPQCIVTVFVHGGGLATIFADNSGTPLANPFQSQLSGQIIFYAANGRYDIAMSPGTTYVDWLLCDPSLSATGCSGGGSTLTGSGTVNFLAKFTSATTIGNSTCFDDGTNPTRCPNGMDTVLNGYYVDYTVDTGGVVANELVCRSSVNLVVICPAGATTTVIGVAQSTVAVGGVVEVELLGHAQVFSTNTATTGHWAIPSATTPGFIDDTGSTTQPTTGTQTFLEESSATAGTLVKLTLLTPDTLNPAGSGTIIQVNGTTTLKVNNFNSTTPAAQALNQNLVFQSSNSGLTSNISVEVPLATTSQAGIVQLTGSLGGTSSNPTIHTNHGISFTLGVPGGATLTVASTTTDYITVPFACTINAYNLAIDAGTITVKFWKIATGTAIPTSSNSISTSGVSISSGTAIHSTTLSDFTTTAVAANDIMAMNVTAVATAAYVNGVLSCQE